MHEPHDTDPGRRATDRIAHDLNNRLTSIANALQLLRLKLSRGQTEGLERYLDIGDDNVRGAVQLTRELQSLDERPET